MAACQNLLIRFTTASFTSPTADASVCTAKKLISARSSQGKPWGSKKSKKVFGWSALWSTISATSIWRKKLCSLSTTLLAQKCNLCLRYDLSPMSPGRTLEKLVEPMGFEPTTSSMPSRRAPNCATAPPNFPSLPQDYFSQPQGSGSFALMQPAAHFTSLTY